MMSKDLQKITEGWLENPRKKAKVLVDYYGQPDEYCDSFIVWRACAPWKRTILSNIEVPHNFPSKHTDYLEQFIDYKVPLEKIGDLAIFDGSVIVERTKGEMSARCGGTSMNFVAINLAHEIITNKRTVSEARQKYKELYLAFQEGKKHEYTQKFIFENDKADTKDPDKSVI